MPILQKKKRQNADENAMPLFDIASPEQVAEIRALRKQKEKYLSQYLTLYSTMLGMLAPTLIYSGLLAPGRPLNSLYESIINSVAAQYLFDRNNPLERTVATFSLAREHFRSLIKDIELRQFILKTAVDAAKGLDLTKGISGIASALSKVKETGNSFHPLLNLKSWQQLESNDFFESLDALSTPTGFQQAAKTGSLATRLLIKQFDNVETVVDYKQYFLNMIVELAGNSRHETWGQDLRNAVRYSLKSSNSYGEPIQVIEGLAEGVSKKSFRELFKLIVWSNNAQIITGLLVAEQYGVQFMEELRHTAKNKGQLYAYRWFLLVATGVGMLGKAYIADPFVRVIYNRFIETPLPLGHNKQLLQAKEAEQIITELRHRNTLLARKAARNIRISRRLSLIFIPMLMYFAFVPGDISAEFAIFAMCIFLTALSNGKQELSAWYAATRLEQDLKERRAFLMHAIPQSDEKSIQLWKDPRDTNTRKANTLASCYFVIRPNKYLSIDAFLVCQVIKKVLLKYGIDIISYGPTLIAIAADSPMSTKNVRNIQQSITLALDKLNGGKQLRRQLSRLNDALGKENHVVSRSQNLATDTNQYLLLIPEPYQTILTQEKLVEVFAPNQIEISNIEKDSATPLEESHYQILTLTGHEPTNDKKLGQLISAVETLKWSLLKNSSPNSPSKHATMLTKRVRRATHAEDDKEEDVDSKAQDIQPVMQTSPQVHIQWKSAAYNSNTPDTNPVPIESRYLKRNKFFTFFPLKEEDFPDKRSYERFKDKAERSKLAVKKDDEGILFIDEMTRDNHGAFFCAKAKLKVKGTYGNMRVYAAEEQSDTGEILYVFKGVNAHSH